MPNVAMHGCKNGPGEVEVGFDLRASSLPVWTFFGAAMIVLKTISNNWLQVINFLYAEKSIGPIF